MRLASGSGARHRRLRQLMLRSWNGAIHRLLCWVWSVSGRSGARYWAGEGWWSGRAHGTVHGWESRRIVSLLGLRVLVLRRRLLVAISGVLVLVLLIVRMHLFCADRLTPADVPVRVA